MRHEIKRETLTSTEHKTFMVITIKCGLEGTHDMHVQGGPQTHAYNSVKS